MIGKIVEQHAPTIWLAVVCLIILGLLFVPQVAPLLLSILTAALFGGYIFFHQWRSQAKNHEEIKTILEQIRDRLTEKSEKKLTKPISIMNDIDKEKTFSDLIEEKVDSGEMDLDELKQICFGFLFDFGKSFTFQILGFLIAFLIPLTIYLATGLHERVLPDILNFFKGYGLIFGIIYTILVVIPFLLAAFVGAWLGGRGTILGKTSPFKDKINNFFPDPRKTIKFYFEMKQKILQRKN